MTGRIRIHWVASSRWTSVPVGELIIRVCDWWYMPEAMKAVSRRGQTPHHNSMRTSTGGRLTGWGVMLGSLLGSIGLFCSPCIGRPTTLADLETMSAPGNVSVDGAPDGSALAVGIKGRVILLELKERLQVGDLGVGFGPQWAPNSQWLAF